MVLDSLYFTPSHFWDVALVTIVKSDQDGSVPHPQSGSVQEGEEYKGKQHPFLLLTSKWPGHLSIARLKM